MGNASGCKPPSFIRSGGLPIVNAQSSQLHQIRLGVWFWTTMTTHMAEDACVRVVSRLWDGCNGLVLPLRDTPAFDLLLWPDHIGSSSWASKKGNPDQVEDD